MKYLGHIIWQEDLENLALTGQTEGRRIKENSKQLNDCVNRWQSRNGRDLNNA